MNKKGRNLKEFRKITSYIMQNDSLLLQLTVKEQMYFAGALKLSKVAKSLRRAIILEIVKALGLENVYLTKTAKLSGGQVKRLSIGLELLSNPPLMFLDEPTSGLDSLASYQCISILKALAKGGRTIIFTIHQPSSRIFDLFDDLLIITQGQVLYQGKSRDMVPYLTELGLHCPGYYNPADFSKSELSEWVCQTISFAIYH